LTCNFGSSSNKPSKIFWAISMLVWSVKKPGSRVFGSLACRHRKVPALRAAPAWVVAAVLALVVATLVVVGAALVVVLWVVAAVVALVVAAALVLVVALVVAGVVVAVLSPQAAKSPGSNNKAATKR
jgi:hypothetical protein